MSTLSKRFETCLATDPDTVREAQALRYRVFAQEMGAKLHSATPGLDVDEIDAYCDHLIVRDHRTERVVGYTRLLCSEQAAKLGRFYSENEFTLNKVLQLPGRFLEVGRTCVDRDYRGNAIIATLWSGLAEYLRVGGFHYLMGCASIPPGPNGFAVAAVYRQIEPDQLGPSHVAVTPRRPIPAQLRCERDESGIPPLLKAYLRLGAWVCGEPCWDEDFNVMDVFVLLDIERLQSRYERHFIGTKATGDDATLETNL